MDLEGKVAIVTGASSGVGWLAARRLAEAGMKVTVTARREAALEALARTIADDGGECLAAAADVTKDDEVRSVVERTVERFGRVDLLVNNAGVQIYDWFEGYTWDEIQRVFDVTCFGYMRFARAVLPRFRAQGSGHILNVASMLARGAAPLLSAYTAAKHAILGWSESLRLELYRTDIRVSAILLPSVSTPMFDHAPMKLGRAPQPVPPTYDTEVAARAIVRVARKPRPQMVPVFLQGKLALWAQRWIPKVTDAIMGRWGASMQMRDEPRDPHRGNLFAPIPEGVGPYGSVPPTPKWKRLGGAALLFGALGAALGGIALATREAVVDR